MRLVNGSAIGFVVEFEVGITGFVVTLTNGFTPVFAVGFVVKLTIGLAVTFVVTFNVESVALLVVEDAILDPFSFKSGNCSSQPKPSPIARIWKHRFKR